MVQQYSEVYSLLDPELFDTIDSVGSALSLHGYLVLLVELGVDVETCIQRARRERLEISTQPAVLLRVGPYDESRFPGIHGKVGLEIYRRLYTELAQP
ncbi:hypothetical protein HBI41_125760 [Parastagonospora nodorum]|nr:hypothetical protein HBI41_125760 [Parastagonospora nodorum]